MSMAIAHFALGAGLTTLVVALAVPNVAFPRLWVLAGGGWAMIPDFHWVSPVAGEWLRQFHEAAAADLFWFHRTLDTVDPTDSKAVAAALLAFLFLSTAVAEYWDYRAPEQVRTAYGEYLDLEGEE